LHREAEQAKPHHRKTERTRNIAERNRQLEAKSQNSLTGSAPTQVVHLLQKKNSLYSCHVAVLARFRR
jgi:hypothetical protein